MKKLLFGKLVLACEDEVFMQLRPQLLIKGNI